MTTPQKTYQNVSFKELITYAEQNPNRSRTLDTIKIRTPLIKQETALDHLDLKGYTAIHLQPAGILSVFACLADPSYYSLAATSARTQLLIDLSTALQQETENLKNTSLARKRKKLYDLIGAAYNGSRLEEKDYMDLFHGISHMRNLHFILLKEAVQEKVEDDRVQQETGVKGDIVFSSDPSTWKKEHPVWIADYRGNWVALPSESNAQPLSSFLVPWLTTIEQHGWIVQWPEVDGTKTEIVEKLSVMPGWKETDKKLLKEVLGVRLGKENALNVLRSMTA
jgi:hypothetical protein